MDRFLAIQSFAKVVESGSFARAADRLNVSTSAVSRQVSELEAHLDVRLLNRTTRRLSLTDDGQLFYARAKELLAAIDEAESEIASRSGEATGLLRINAPLTFGVMHLAPLWGGFLAQHPKVSLEIDLSDRVVDLVDEGYDLAVRITTLPSSQLVSRLLASSRVVLCASPGYLARHGAPTHPRELAAHQVISYSYWATRDEWSFRGPEGEVRVRTHPRMHANNGDTCRAAALDGQGIILQPDFLVGEDLRRGTLVELLPDYAALTVGIQAVYPSRKFLPIKTRRMVDFLVDAFATPPWR